MGKKHSIIKQADVEGITFQAEKFMESVSDTVDLSRSDVGSNPGLLITTALDAPSSEKAESRLNCFFRLLGLPATRDVSKINREKREDADLGFITQSSTLNYFDSNSLKGVLFPGQSLTDNIGDVVNARERELSKRRTPAGFSLMMDNPLSLNELSTTTVISETIQDEGLVVRKTSIFPLIVDASIPVFPILNRTAPLFYDGDFILGGVQTKRLARTFIESVIYIRTQRFTEDASDQINSITENTKTFVLGLNPKETLSSEKEEEVAELVKSLGVSNNQVNFNLIEAQMINRLVQAISSSAKAYRQIVQETKKTSNQVRFYPEPKKTAKEKSGNTSQIISGSKQNQFLEQRGASINAQIEETNVLLSLLPTNKVLEADARKRLLDSTPTTADLAPDFFVSEFTDVVAWNLESLKQQMRSIDKQKMRSTRKLEILKSQIMYFSGEVQGLSVFDILCVFLALFTLDFDHLVGLLNQDARDRLENNSFFSDAASSNNNSLTNISLNNDKLAQDIPVADCLIALQTKVKENFGLASAFFNDVRAGQNRG